MTFPAAGDAGRALEMETGVRSSPDPDGGCDKAGMPHPGYSTQGGGGW